MTCRCGHGPAMHDLAKNGTRTASSVLTGPAGTPCGCTHYTPTTETP